MRSAMLAALAIFAFTTSISSAGEWLGGQYWGQIGGCAYCGGSLYGLGYPYPYGDCGCESQAPTQAPLTSPHAIPQNPPLGVNAIANPQVPGLSVMPTSHVQHGEPPMAGRTYDDILPIAPSSLGAGVQTVTHSSMPERLTPPQHRLVAPNAWSAPRYR